MADNKKSNVVNLDSSSAFDKLEELIKLGYLQRTIWERKINIDVLGTDGRYIDMILCDKQFCGDSSGTSTKFHRRIDSSFFTDVESQRLLFSTVTCRYEKQDNLTENQKFINSTKEKENFLFVSVFPNIKTSTETAFKGSQITTLESIQLFRYDPTGKTKHENVKENAEDKIYTFYKQNYGTETANLYRTFFTEKVDFPHFHFMNRTISELCGKTAEGDAISLDCLIDYIEKLMNATENDNPLNNCSFGMPYLEIKKNPDKYRTAINMYDLNSALKNNSVNKQIGSIFYQTQNIGPETVVLNGLNAVYADLVLLRILRNLSDSNNFNLRQISGNEQVCGFNGGSEEPKYDVSMREFQIASKIATAGTMTLSKTKEVQDINFQDRTYYIDDFSYDKLCRVLKICQREKCKGDNDEPIL